MIKDKIKKIFSIFDDSREPPIPSYQPTTYISNVAQPYISIQNARSIVGTLYNRIAIDASLSQIKHVLCDSDGNYKETINDDLNYCLTLSPNKDQIMLAFYRDLIISLFDEGCVAIVPVEYEDKMESSKMDIYQLRVARICQWEADHVVVHLYNDQSGKFYDVRLRKDFVAIVENPFYLIMNEPNSVLQQLKSTLLDVNKANKMTTSSKLDLLIRLPYSLSSKNKQERAEIRQKEIDDQLNNSKFGIGYIDATEQVIQLNRPINNTLWEQAKDLTNELFAQLGISIGIIDNTASEEELSNYISRIVNPVLDEITNAMTRSWISREDWLNGERIQYYSDPFRFTTPSKMSEVAASLKQNEVATANEMRSAFGYVPSKDEKANELRNSNINPK